jgi:hypothetical protein
MLETRITLPELGLIAGTRAAAGAGLGLLLADRLSEEQRKAVGWALFIFGALTTIPLALDVFGGRRKQDVSGYSSEADESIRQRNDLSAV